MPFLDLVRSFLQSSKVVMLCTLGLLASCFTSAAHADNIQWSLGVNSGGYYSPQPGVSLQMGNGHRHPPAPQVIVVQPAAPVYMAPAPVYVHPAPRYKPGRGHYRSPPPRHGHRHRGHHHRHHDRD